ncbi:hypothetical protein FC093_05420 [Ilyomonas limi]|uniref:Peptidase S8/S53 domain-containing protein n=1 Tax=Ilyomonas limi TaxID=2575867 RepID=A0A4U3L5C1_9BACT|nr:S8 family serine peptidase [Ilyomonas limi]TKK70190.1 hypothetical protein FC093_05420 [Ilyomonas limi]
MKRHFLFAFLIATLCLAVIAFSGFRYFQKELYYYEFNEKKLLEIVPNKFVLRFTGSDIAKAKLTAFEKSGLLKPQEWKDERTIIVNFLKAATDKIISDLQDEPEMVSVQPLYTTSAEKLDIAATDEILVRFKKGTVQEVIDRTIKNFNLQLKEKGELFYTFTVAKKANTLAVANAIMESGVAEFSNPNFYRRIEMYQVPNDEFFNYQWNLRNTGQVINDGHTGTPGADIKAVEAWPITMGSSSVVVAVIDEGVTSNHPDLPNTRQVRLNGSNFSTSVPGNNPSPIGDGDHGNACSGIIAATRNNSEGVAGIAPNCKIMPIKILNPAASDANIANAITFAKNNGAQVISNSWGYGTSDPNYIPAIVTAINDAVTTGRGGLGCVMAFAATNTADHVHGSAGYVGFPGNVNIAGVLTVGASDRYDKQANYSPTSNPASANNQIVDIVAPSHRAYPTQIAGEDFEIWSMDIPGTSGYNPQSGGTYLPASGTNYQSYTGRMGGTSAATPEVAAAAALLLSKNANLTQQQVFNILTQNADKVGGYTYNSSGFSNEMGFGRLNLYRAVLKAGADLYMKDQTTDSGIEPNPSTDAYYATPDIWVRNSNDGGTVHQNPEAGQTNYVYVRVRNRGYLSSPASGSKLKLYWAKASTGLSWTFPWTGATYSCSGSTVSIGGQIGSAQTISSISAGSYTTLVFAWTPPKPSDYPCFGADASHFCLLARIETKNSSPYGMAFSETTNLGNNVKDNNNIVWKNVSIVNLLPDMSTFRTSVLIAGAKLLRRSFSTTDIAFNVPDEKGNNNILGVANIDIDLGEFTEAWLKNNGKVEGGRVYQDKNGKTLIRVAATKGRIYGVPIGATQMGSITVAVTPVQFSTGLLYLFDVQQVDRTGIIGGERFDIQFNKTRTATKAAAPVASNTQPATKDNSQQQLKVYQAGKQLNIVMNDGKEYVITVANSFGQVLTTAKMINQKVIPVNNYLQGIYYIKLINAKEQKIVTASVMIQ